jgi:hypothetical protein
MGDVVLGNVAIATPPVEMLLQRGLLGRRLFSEYTAFQPYSLSPRLRAMFDIEV